MTVRTCAKCKVEKPLAEFSKDRTQAGGFAYSCKPCDRLRKKQRRGTLGKHEACEALAAEGKKRCTKCSEVKDLDGFRMQKRKGGSYPASWCRACQNELSKECERKKAPQKKLERAEAAKRRPPRPPRISNAERAKRWREQNPEKMKAAHAKYRKTEKGKLTHRLVSGRRRARMDGTITAEQWERVVAAWRGRCAYCRSKGSLTIDHVTPVSRGGKHVISNVVPACKRCNDTKNDAPLHVALPRLGVDRFRWQARRTFALRAALS